MLVKFNLIYVFLLFFMSNGRFFYCQSSYDTPHTEPDQNELNTPSQLVEEIVRKVCNMTTHTLASSPNDEKESLIQKIENKLLRSVKDLQFNNSYVKMIMKGVRLVAYNTRKSDDTETEIENKSNMPSQETLVNNIAKKVEYIAKAYSETEKAGDKNKVMEDIKQEVKKAALKKHKELHDKHDKIITYSKLISRGIAQAIENINESRRMELEFVNTAKPYEYTTEESNTSINKGIIEATEAREKISSTTVMPSDHENIIRELKCEDMKKRICTEIKLINTLKCHADNTELSIEKLCDGTVDCSDSSDEINCTETALEVVRKVNEVMSEIELAITQKCYPPSVQNTVIANENAILKDVLRNQVNLIQKHSKNDGSPDFNTRSFPAILNKAKNTINEVVMVIHILALALQTALCPDHKLRNDKINSENSDDITTNNIIAEGIFNNFNFLPTKATLASCICDDQNCAHSNCRVDCKHVCGQKYSFGRWHCDAVNRENSVSLDELCDGKLDCVDESDENGCFDGSSLAKFEATNIFSLIVQSALFKTQTERVTAIRVMLVKFMNNVKSLQMLTEKNNPNKLEIKGIRDQCIVDMTSVYEEYLKKTTSIVQMNEIYAFLINLKEKLISAIKRSHTGNDRIITAGGCHCTHNECSLSSCSKACVKACGAEPILTRYYCGDSNRYEDSIPITTVCDGKKDCPNNDDEVDCKKDPCRKHHILLLRNNLRNLGNHVRKTALGEAIYSWKIKVAATLRIAESDDRPTPKVIRGIVKSILRDLLMTYAGMEETLARRSNNDLILNQFYNISQTVIATIKSCGQ